MGLRRTEESNDIMRRIQEQLMKDSGKYSLPVNLHA